MSTNNNQQDNIEKGIHIFQKSVYFIILLLLAVLTSYLIYHYTKTLFLRLCDGKAEVITIPEIKEATIIGVSGVLAIVLCLELLETIYSSYKEKDHTIQISKILLIAIVASVRHIFEIDYMHAQPLNAIAAGLGLLMVTGCYYLYKRASKSNE